MYDRVGLSGASKVTYFALGLSPALGPWQHEQRLKSPSLVRPVGDGARLTSVGSDGALVSAWRDGSKNLFLGALVPTSFYIPVQEYGYFRRPWHTLGRRKMRRLWTAAIAARLWRR